MKLKVPPFHLIIIGAPATGSKSPTAKPSLSLTINTERRIVPVSTGDVVVLQIDPDTELQLERQNSATPEAPTDHIFPPETAKVTPLRSKVVDAIWLTGIFTQFGAVSRDVP